MAQYIYNDLVKQSQLDKYPNGANFIDLATAANFLHLNTIKSEGPVNSWSVTYNKDNKTLTFTAKRTPSATGDIKLHFYLLPTSYPDTGIKGHFNNNTSDIVLIDTTNGIVLTNDKLIIHLDTQLQGFMKPAYSYLQNGDYAYSELFEQGERNVETSQNVSDVYILNEYKNGYPKVEIPLYGINGKCIRGYSNIFATENKGLTKDKTSTIEDIDTYYGNTLASDLINTYRIQDTTKIFKPKQFRSKSFGLVKNTGKYKTLYKWSDYAAEDRIRITVEYDGEQVIIKNYSLPQQINTVTYSDLKDNFTSQTIAGKITRYHHLVKDELDLSWESENWIEKAAKPTTITYKTKDPTILFEVYKGETYTSFNGSTTPITTNPDKTGGSWIYNSRDVSSIEMKDNNGHYYQVNLKSVNKDNFNIKPTLYSLTLKTNIVYEFTMTGFQPITYDNPNLYFYGGLDYSNFPLWAHVFKTNKLKYTAYDGVVTIPKDSIKLTNVIDNTDFYEPTIYYININDNFNRTYFDTRDDNTTYLISINMGRPLDSTSTTNYKSLFINSFNTNTTVETMYDVWGSDHCRVFLPNFIEKNINYANIKGLPNPTLTNNSNVPYNFVSDYRKNYFLSIVTASNNTNTYNHVYELCPAYEYKTKTLKWKSATEDIWYGFPYVTNSRANLSTIHNNWIEEFIWQNYYDKVITYTDFSLYQNYMALIVDNEKWNLGNQQNRYLIIPPYPKTVQSLNGGTIKNLINASNPQKESTLCIYPLNNYSIGGLVIYAKEED